MTTCRETQDSLALYAGGDLDVATREQVRRHLDACQECQQEVTDYTAVMRLAREAYAAAPEFPAAVRARVARDAAARVARHPWWARLLPLPGHQALAAVVPAVLVVVAVAAPFALRDRRAEPARETPVRIDLQAEDGGVRVAWSDGRGKPYRVYKSTDPRLLGRGPAREVRGNQWVDSESDSAPVVFYRVE